MWHRKDVRWKLKKDLHRVQMNPLRLLTSQLVPRLPLPKESKHQSLDAARTNPML